MIEAINQYTNQYQRNLDWKYLQFFTSYSDFNVVSKNIPRCVILIFIEYIEIPKALIFR